MHDHRFDFEHIWRLRTPEFEVLKASAERKACEQCRFNPELCRRYRDIRGARIGREFSKRILTKLGDLPGAEEHLFLAIEWRGSGNRCSEFRPASKPNSPSITASAPVPRHTIFGEQIGLTCLSWLILVTLIAMQAGRCSPTARPEWDSALISIRPSPSINGSSGERNYFPSPSSETQRATISTLAGIG